MFWSHKAINRIGDIIRQEKQDKEYDSAITELNRWREAHGAPMNFYYDQCNNIIKKVHKDIIVAQRLKRLPTIINKLQRFDKMRLSSMQDVAGVRIIVRDMDQLGIVERELLNLPGLKRVKDRIKTPKEDGYRGKHFIFKKDDMYVEIQLRTHLQHLWATSVETLDIFTGKSMKTNPSEDYWGTFFQLTSSTFASAENTPALKIHQNLPTEEVYKNLQQIITRHSILNQVRAYSYTHIIREGKVRGAYYAVMTLDFSDPNCRTALVGYFSKDDYGKAFEEYSQTERDAEKPGNTVLVSVNDIKKLREAYPNYFTDLREFIVRINDILDFLHKKE